MKNVLRKIPVRKAVREKGKKSLRHCGDIFYHHAVRHGFYYAVLCDGRGG